MLSGLSSAQYDARLTVSDDEMVMGSAHWDVSPRAFNLQIFDEVDRINPVDPVYAIPQSSREDIVAYFAAKQGF